MKKKLLAVMLVAAIAVLALAGCGKNRPDSVPPSGNSQEKVKLVLWGSADDQEMLSRMVEDFKVANSHKQYDIEIRVNGEDVAGEEALKDIEAAADVFAIANDQLGALVNADAVYENTKYADDIISSRTESSVSAAKIGGRLYGYPSSSETYFLFYNRSLLSDSDVQSLESILSADVGSGVTPFAMDFTDAYFSSSFFMTAGCEIYGKDGQDPSTVTFNSPEGLAAAQYISQLKSKGAENMDGDVAGARFKAGKLASYISGSWKTDAYSEALGDNLGVAKLPTVNITGEDRNMISFAGGKMYVVKSTTNYPADAMALADFLTSEENQLMRFSSRQLLPNRHSLAENENVLASEPAAAEIAQFDYSIPTPSITQISKYWDPVGAFTLDCFEGKISSADMQARLDTLVSDITVKGQ